MSLNDNSYDVMFECVLFVDWLIRYTDVLTASAHHIVEMPLKYNMLRVFYMIVRLMHSATPFCWRL